MRYGSSSKLSDSNPFDCQRQLPETFKLTIDLCQLMNNLSLIVFHVGECILNQDEQWSIVFSATFGACGLLKNCAKASSIPFTNRYCRLPASNKNSENTGVGSPVRFGSLILNASASALFLFSLSQTASQATERIAFGPTSVDSPVKPHGTNILRRPQLHCPRTFARQGMSCGHALVPWQGAVHG